MDRAKPTTQLLGRFQPWHDGHTELFKRALSKTGQVVILLRESDGTESNPLGIKDRIARLRGALSLAGYKYGRDVGYKIEEEVLDAETQAISATKIREQWSKI